MIFESSQNQPGIIPMMSQGRPEKSWTISHSISDRNAKSQKKTQKTVLGPLCASKHPSQFKIEARAAPALGAWHLSRSKGHYGAKHSPLDPGLGGPFGQNRTVVD